MKKQMWLTAVPAILVAAGVALAAGKSSVELGKEMYFDPKLGGSTNDSSCNSCHEGGRGLENAPDNKKFTKLINNCLVGQMGGEKLDGRMVSMRSLKMYIKSLHR